MQVNIDEVNTTRRKLAVEVPVEEVAAEFNRAFERVQKQAKLKGFRPGRAPRAVVEKLFGDQVRTDVLSHLIEHSYADAVKQAGLRPVGPPEIVPESIEAGKPLRYSATIDVLPKIDIGDTRGLRANRTRREVTEADVDRAVEQLCESLAELRPLEDREEAREGDFVSVDYEGFVEGRPLPGGKRENRLFELGKGAIPPEFERALSGAKVGESKTVEISYPADHADATVAGKTARFDLVLRAVRQKIVPSADDELAKEHGECTTLAELRAKLRERIADSWRLEGDEQVREQVVDELLGRNPFEIPASLVDRQVNAFVEDLLERAGAQREMLERDTQRLDKLREEYRPRAERQVRAVLALDAVVERDNVEVSEQDVDGRVGEIVRRGGEHASQLREIYRDPASRGELRARMARERALDAIVAAASVEDVDAPGNIVAPMGEKG
jgi:trigger factor